MGIEGKAVRILNNGTIWRGYSIICFTPIENTPGFNKIKGWVGTRTTQHTSVEPSS